MTTLLFVFFIALALSLILTPLAGRLGLRFKALDLPNERKVHSRPIPRTGGLGIFLAFFSTLFLTSLLNTQVANLLAWEREAVFLLTGGVVAFGVGLYDDFHRLSPTIKLFFQIVAASLVYWGGVRFHLFGVALSGTLTLDIIGYIVIVFWFVLFINAVNLIDGLDGLAGGIMLFASLVMLILSLIRNDLYSAILFTGLFGSVLGFLRYNFNPAILFLGDGGSYFLGYTMAGIALLSSIKSQVSAVMLIPLLALGVPLFDALLSPIRRFLLGKGIFQADKGHFHHRLHSMGLNAGKVVWILYGITALLCITALLVVNLNNEKVGLLLILLGLGAVFFIKRIGYLDHVTLSAVLYWLQDVTDVAGISYQRRSFLSVQLDIAKSKTLQELWDHIVNALEMLSFEYAALYLNQPRQDPARNELAPSRRPAGSRERRMIAFQQASVDKRQDDPEFTWTCPWLQNNGQHSSRCLLRVELPLVGQMDNGWGRILLIKDIKRKKLTHFSLRRVEHLRRSVIRALDRFQAAEDRSENRSSADRSRRVVD
ncbi:MAG: undecaprenyl/decaprenyl-phosphate alpha-N-acetylglucosaminyl 1-phosphate transferase [Desulfohalobiaceae bacterium]|nr:undecaprenyl/decaprenyl-phosphate alpha-N-acetylglucosaminyl 1-phosphate transferase [Desulfohalobiaceae bacterium]